MFDVKLKLLKNEMKQRVINCYGMYVNKSKEIVYQTVAFMLLSHMAIISSRTPRQQACTTRRTLLEAQRGITRNNLDVLPIW